MKPLMQNLIDELKERQTLMDTREVSQLLNCATATVCNYAKSGLIPSVHVGDLLRFCPRALAAVLEKEEGS